MQKPIISIVTSNFNHEHFLPEAIESVLTQAGDFFIDYQIIDGNSSDRSVEVIKGYEQRLKDNCDIKQLNAHNFYIPRSREFELCQCLGVSFSYISEADEGMYNGINKGIKTAVGDIFGYINSDDYYLPYAFQTISDSFFKNPDAGLIYGETLQVNKEREVIGRYPVKDVYKHSLYKQNLIDQPGAFVSIGMFEKHGAFNNKIPNSADYEYWVRLLSATEKFVKIESVLAASRIYAETKTSQNRGQIHLESFAISKHYGGKLTSHGREEFTMGLSLFGRSSWLIVRGFTWLRKKKLSLLTKLYLILNKSKIEKEEQRIFSIRSKELEDK